MSELYLLDTYYSRHFLVMQGDKIVYRGKDWSAARNAYHELEGRWIDQPTADAAEVLEILQRVDNDIARQQVVQVVKSYDNPVYPPQEDDNGQ